MFNLIAIIFITLTFFESVSFSQQANRKNDTCDCKPSLSLEIGATSIVWGIPTYALWRGVLLKNPKDSLSVGSNGLLIGPSLFLLMFSLGPIAEWNSGCEGSWWNTLWIGLGTSATATLIYGLITNSLSRPGDVNSYKYNIVDYLALGVIPSVCSTLLYNMYLHPKEKNNQSMYLLPSFGGKSTASLNFMMQF
ncbi:MAG: hypothetical protein WCH46_00360 [bacterium]